MGGQPEFRSMLPIICSDANVLLFMFDLSDTQSLYDVKEWYRQARGLNSKALMMLIGTKYDLYSSFPPDKQNNITLHARKYASAMKAPLVYCSVTNHINIQQIFKLILMKAFDLNVNIKRNENTNEPIIEY